MNVLDSSDRECRDSDDRRQPGRIHRRRHVGHHAVRRRERDRDSADRLAHATRRTGQAVRLAAILLFVLSSWLCRHRADLGSRCSPHARVARVPWPVARSSRPGTAARRSAGWSCRRRAASRMRRSCGLSAVSRSSSCGGLRRRSITRAAACGSSSDSPAATRRTDVDDVGATHLLQDVAGRAGPRWRRSAPRRR